MSLYVLEPQICLKNKYRNEDQLKESKQKLSRSRRGVSHRHGCLADSKAGKGIEELDSGGLCSDWKLLP